MNLVNIARLDHLSRTDDLNKSIWSAIFDNSDMIHQRSLLRNQKSLSTWLTTAPIRKDGFDLSTYEFRDALCIPYLKPLPELPPNCDGCGSIISTSHALDCRKGGLVIQRHNEIRDLLHDLMSIVWSQTVKEPIVREATVSPPATALVGDIRARGVWNPQSMAIFDIRVIDSDAPSYLSKSPDAVLRTAERDKKLKYTEACDSKHSSFTPLCITIDGLVGNEMKYFMGTGWQSSGTSSIQPHFTGLELDYRSPLLELPIYA